MYPKKEHHHIRDGVRAVQECKLHRQFEDINKLLVAIEFMKITQVLTLL